MTVQTRFLRLCGDSPETLLVIVGTLVALVLKLTLSATTIGTNDVLAWYEFSEFILNYDSFSIYGEMRYYNHPPLISSWLYVIGSLSIDNLRVFAFLMRLPAIFADFGSAILIWTMARRFYGDRRSFFVTMVFVFSPVLLLVSGFHGNTDPVFIFLILSAIYLVGVRQNMALGGVLFGLAMNIKIVPILMVPAFFFWFRSISNQIKFFLPVILILVAGYGAHLYFALQDMMTNIFLYGGLSRIWGIGRLFDDYRSIGKIVLFVVVTIGVWAINWLHRDSRGDTDRLRPLLLSFGFTFLAFLVVTPGFGVQYLSWLAAPAVFMGPVFSAIYALLAGYFLLDVYVFWSGGFPLYLADSNEVGQWLGSTIAVEQTLWLFLLVAFAGLGLKVVLRLLDVMTSGQGIPRPLDKFSELGSFDSKGKRIAIFVISYNAEQKILKTLGRIPEAIWNQVEEVFVIDDCSPDKTYQLADAFRESSRAKPVNVLRNKKNQGYGGNQKVGYEYAISKGYDIVVMLHGDGQYAPEIMDRLLQPLIEEEADMVFGSRMTIGCNPRAGGMPLYKYWGNKILTAVENRIASMQLSEFHSGYRAYSCHALQQLPLELNSDDFYFDTEILLQMNRFGLRISEAPIPTYYGDEICHVNGMAYAFNCVLSVCRYWLTVKGVIHSVKYDPNAWKNYPYEEKLLDHFSSQQLAISFASDLEVGSSILEIGPGSGAISSELSKRGQVVTVIESDSRFADHARAYADRILFEDVETFQWNALEDFDMVIMADVLEHVRNPESFLDHCIDHLDKDGRIFISLPNVAHWSTRLGLLLGRFNYSDRGILDRTHVRFYTKKSAMELLFRAGLLIEKYTVTPVPLPLILPVTSAGRGLSWIHSVNHLITQCWRSLFGYQLVFCCRLAPGRRMSRIIDSEKQRKTD